MKILLLCGMLHQMYHVVAYVMPENQFFYSCCLYFHNFLLIKSGLGNLMGKIQWNNSLCSLTYTDGVEIDTESDEQR